MLLFTFLALFNINVILFHFTKNSGNKRWYLFLGISLFLFWAYIVENLYLVNYTRTALLLSFSSLACLFVLFKSYRNIAHYRYYLLFYIFLFLLGWNTRFTLVLLLMPIMIFFIWAYLPKRKAFVSISSIVIFSIFYIGFSWLILSDERKDTMRDAIQSERYIVNILDGANRDQNANLTKEDSIKVFALKYWFFADKETVLDFDFLEKVGRDNPLKSKALATWKSNIIEEIDKAANYYPQHYMPGMNWWWKTKFMIIILFALPLIMFVTRQIDKIGFMQIGGFVIASLAYILAITLFVKMEDRALSPTLLIILLGVLLISQKKRIQPNYSAYFLMLVMAFISIVRTSSYLDNSRQREIDLQLKHSIQSELSDKFSNKIVLFDLFTVTILETSPLKEIQYPENWISIIETWNRHFDAHSKNLESKVGCIKWPCFLDTISTRSDEFVFFHLEKRTELIEIYCSIIYEQEYKFTQLSGQNIVNDLRYSFHWLPFDFRYYYVEKVDTNYANIND